MKLIFRQHAVRRMFERGITAEDVESVIGAGEIIEDYPSDTPYPSHLVLGWSRGRALHVVEAVDEDVRIIVTVYEPDPRLWSSDFRRRLR